MRWSEAATRLHLSLNLIRSLDGDAYLIGDGDLRKLGGEALIRRRHGFQSYMRTISVKPGEPVDSYQPR